MVKPKSNRTARKLAAILALVALAGCGPLLVRLKPSGVARFRGRSADLSGSALLFAPLQGADLTDANLQSANLRGANLRGADLTRAQLRGTRLAFTDLRGALGMSGFVGQDLEGANLSG